MGSGQTLGLLIRRDEQKPRVEIGHNAICWSAVGAREIVLASLQERSRDGRLRLSVALSGRTDEDADQSGKTRQVCRSSGIRSTQDVTFDTRRVRVRGRGMGDVERHDGPEDGISGHGEV